MITDKPHTIINLLSGLTNNYKTKHICNAFFIFMVPIGGGSAKSVLSDRWIVYTKRRKQLLHRKYLLYDTGCMLCWYTYKKRGGEEGIFFEEEEDEDDIYLKFGHLKNSDNFFLDRQTDRSTDRQTDRHTDRPTDRQTDRQTLWFIGMLHIQKERTHIHAFKKKIVIVRRQPKEIIKCKQKINFDDFKLVPGLKKKLYFLGKRSVKGGGCLALAESLR